MSKRTPRTRMAVHEVAPWTWRVAGAVVMEVDVGVPDRSKLTPAESVTVYERSAGYVCTCGGCAHIRRSAR